MRGLFCFLIGYLGIVFNTCCQEKGYAPVLTPDGYQRQIDVIYTQVDGWEGRMDLYTIPLAQAPTPILINIHGGGWNHGVKEAQRGFQGFFKHGYAVANIEYRLVQVAPAPAAVEDVHCALAYIHQHADALNIDRNKIVVRGASSGGHLALMTGFLGDKHPFEDICGGNRPLSVAAIIDHYGVTDLSLLNRGSVKRWLAGNAQNESFIASVSPIHYVTTDSPPVFIVHGDEDPLIPYEQSVMLYKKLQSKNVKATLITVDGGKHGKFPKEDKKMVNEKMWAFLKGLGL